MKSIRLFSWWTDSHSITNRFKQQFIGEHFNNPDIEFVLGDQYDYAIVFGYTKEQIKTDKNHTIYYMQEPYWSDNWDRDANNKSSRIFVPDKTRYGNHKEMISEPCKMFYGGHGDMHHEFKWNWSVDSMLAISPCKNKNLSVVQSNNIPNYSKGTIYSERCDLVNGVKDSSLEIEIYGNYHDTDNPKSFGNCWNKKIGLNDYRFSISIENTVLNNYFTEKFYDCILCDTIPVYYGAPNIDNYIDSSSFLQLPSLNIEECLEFLKNQCTVENYNKRFNSLQKLKHNFFTRHDINLWVSIQKEIL
tara:strand:+ start:2121 stop:3029 length:909 start_codon:yes stop_codon:yes gene_type:complete